MTPRFSMNKAVLGVLAGLTMLSAGSITPAQADVIYFKNGTPYSVALRICHDFEGHVLQMGRRQYGCQSDEKVKRVYKRPPPPPPGDNIPEIFIKSVKAPAKKNNFGAADITEYHDGGKSDGGSRGGNSGHGGQGSTGLK